jgi:hypothetical protein
VPRISDFAVIRRDSLQLQPQDADGNLPFDFSKTFDLPNVSESDDDFAILSFMANPSSNADLRVRFLLDDAPVLDQKFETDPQRAWHEVLPVSVLQPPVHRFRLEVLPGGTGTIRFSNIVLWYQANIP